MNITPQNIASKSDSEIVTAARQVLAQNIKSRKGNPLMGEKLPAKFARFQKAPNKDNACEMLWSYFKAQAYFGKIMGVEALVNA